MFCVWVSHGKVVTSKFSLYLLVWASLCILLILFFKPSFCNEPETELKWKTDIENLYNISILSYTDSWCLVPFSSNISCDRKHIVRLCYDHRGKRFVYQSPNKQFRAEYTASNCYTKHAVTNRIPVTATLIRVNEASDWNDHLLSIKKKAYSRFEEYRLSRNLVFMRSTCTLFGKIAGAWIWPQTTI